MKSIGTITFHKSNNYGAYLQCFALQKTLNDLGYASSIINYETAADIERYKLISTKTPKKLIKSLIFYIPNKKRSKSFRKAQEQYTLSSKDKSFDVAITGSDQVWNPNLSGGTIDPYFTLNGINAKKKISYAASIGSEDSVAKFSDDFKEITRSLDSISVRETQAKRALSQVTNRTIKVTIDPTALVKKDDWLKLINDIPKDNAKYIFSYFIGIRKDQAKALSKICKKLNLKTLSFSQIPKEKHIYKYCYTEGPFKFLARLRDAKLVITSSFHGTILSIIFQKNFYVLMPDPKKRSRIDNILKLTGLSNRIIETEMDIDKVNLKDIDYTEPQIKLDKLREESLDWLKNAIEN